MKDAVSVIFEAGIATSENLSMLFGCHGLVANTIPVLRKRKQKKMQTSITSFISIPRNATKTWSSGSKLLDPKSGLKVEFLKDSPRRLWHIAADPVIKSRASNLNPSVEEFQARFPNVDLGISLFVATEDFSNKSDRDELYGRGGELGLEDFATVEEACQYFFDTTNLHDAILDCCGVPRLLILNGSDERMFSSGWKYRGRCFLGDSSVKLKSRIALAINLPCSDWQRYISSRQNGFHSGMSARYWEEV